MRRCLDIQTARGGPDATRQREKLDATVSTPSAVDHLPRPGDRQRGAAAGSSGGRIRRRRRATRATPARPPVRAARAIPARRSSNRSGLATAASASGGSCLPIAARRSRHQSAATRGRVRLAVFQHVLDIEPVDRDHPGGGEGRRQGEPQRTDQDPEQDLRGKVSAGGSDTERRCTFGVST